MSSFLGYFQYVFDDSPEHKARAAKPYTLPKATLKEIHDAVPKWTHERKTFTSLYYVARMFVYAGLFFTYGTYIPKLVEYLAPYGPSAQYWGSWALWINYWWWASLAGAGFWTLAHEAGHSTLSNHMWVNHAIGYTLHCLVLVPYYGWRYSHNMHHKATNSIERDENFCPSTRTELGLPPPEEAEPSKYAEILEEAPLIVFLRLIIQQALGLEAYLMVNAAGNKAYPAGTNHYSLYSPLFKQDSSSFGILMSDLGLGAVLGALGYYAYLTSFATLTRMYIIPWFLTNHWIVALVFLQHTDPTLPHFRKSAWTFLRGATCTIDRPLLGWMGRYFLHNISHDHVAHHFFSQMPFYHTPVATEAIKKVLGDDYCSDRTNTYRAIYRNFTECQFIEDTGDIVFYRNKQGKPTRRMDGSGSPPVEKN